MGRKKDLERAKLIEKLGASPNKNWSKQELLEMEKKQVEKAAKQAEKNAMTAVIAGEVPNVPPAELDIPYDLRYGTEDPLEGLTERQKRIARLRMRGLSQQAIANIEKVAQPIISRELKRIKEWQAERGANVNQDAVVGETSTLYEDVEQMAWQMYYTPQISVGEKAKCLAVVMSAREKHTKLLMDLGLIKRASQEVTHKVEVSPFLAAWKDRESKKQLADNLVKEQLSTLQEPAPDDITDAEYEEVVADTKAEVTVVSDLAEPTLDIDDE